MLTESDTIISSVFTAIMKNEGPLRLKPLLHVETLS